MPFSGQHRLYLLLAGILILACICLLPLTGQATGQFASATGRECGACHIDPLGGGGLTELGRGYLLSLQPEAAAADRPSLPAEVFRFSALYLHMITAFLWFGTILYVHLVLKPAYASQGLPRGEVRVGLFSMAVMAATGIILTYHRIPSPQYLVSSRFGFLLLLKIIIFLIMVLSALVAVLVIGPRLRRKKAPLQPGSGKYTPQELAGFDGAGNSPAYIAFAGKIYDVSQSPLWKNGAHMQRHHAGADLTGMIGQAPHGEDKVTAMPEVGELVPEKKRGFPGLTVKTVFYAMAYMNLVCVFLILFILALWQG